jgi:hypothetical protein
LWEEKEGTRLVSSPTGTYGNAVTNSLADMRERPPNGWGGCTAFTARQ